MGRAMVTIIGTMAELESSLISERITAGMRAAKARGKHLGRPTIPKRVVGEIEALATSTDRSVRQIQARIAGRASRGVVGEITKRARAPSLPTPCRQTATQCQRPQRADHRLSPVFAPGPGQRQDPG
jgi:hypothetical protein